jgi:membrane fusion protein, multidrug efflux system
MNPESREQLSSSSAAVPQYPQPVEPGRSTPNKRSGRIAFGLGVLAVIGLTVLGYWYYFMRGLVYTDDARLSGDMVDLAPEISGRITELEVHEGQYVNKGQTIFQINPLSYKAMVSQSEAALRSAQADQKVSEANLERALNLGRPEEIKAAVATLKRLKGQEKLARSEYDRVQSLAIDGMAAQDELDQALTAYESAGQNREIQTQNLQLLRLGSRKEDIDAARADLDQARAKVDQAAAALEKTQNDLAHCTIVAPFSGWIVRCWLQPGAMPLTGQPVVSMFDPSSLRVDANIEEKYLYRIAVGDKARINVDAYPDLKMKGQVTQVLRATNSEFSLIPSEGVSGTFIKVSQRVPVRISIEKVPDVPLAPGLSAEVQVLVGSKTGQREKQEAENE